MKKLALSTPWATYRNKLNALFELDNCITVGDVVETGNGHELTIVVTDKDKYIALDRVMAKKIEFGNVVLTINLKLGDSSIADDYSELYKTLFSDNRIVKDIIIGKDFAGQDHCYVRFQPKVIQFFNDDISDYDGNWSGIAQDIAKEVFTDTPVGIHFCTANIHENSVAIKSKDRI